MIKKPHSDASRQALIAQFKEKRCLNSYVTLRRNFPSQVVDVHTTSDFEWIASNQPLLTSLKIDPDLFTSAIDGNVSDLAEICLIIMERLIERKILEKKNETHLSSRGEAISDNIICRRLDLI